MSIPFETNALLHNQRPGTTRQAQLLRGVSFHTLLLQMDLLTSDLAMLPLIHE